VFRSNQCRDSGHHSASVRNVRRHISCLPVLCSSGHLLHAPRREFLAEVKVYAAGSRVYLLAYSGNPGCLLIFIRCFSFDNFPSIMSLYSLWITVSLTIKEGFVKGMW
jgi:hypothetical protein